MSHDHDVCIGVCASVRACVWLAMFGRGGDVGVRVQVEDAKRTDAKRAKEVRRLLATWRDV